MRVFRDLEIVEHLGTGIPRILQVYSKDVFLISQNFIRLVFPFAEPNENTNNKNSSVEAPVDLSSTETKITQLLNKESLDRSALLISLGYQQRTGNFKKSIERLLGANLIELTIPDKPKSRLQKYCITQKGKNILKK